MNIFDIITWPFGILIRVFYNLSGNYIVTLFLFALIIKIVLFPLGISMQKHQINMARLKPKEAAIRKKYAGRKDAVTQQKLQQELSEFYKSENFSPLSGCLPMLLQVLFMFPLYSVVRSPLRYISGIAPEVITNIQKYIFDNLATFQTFLTSKPGSAAAISQTQIIRVLHGPGVIEQIQNAGLGFGAGIEKIVNFAPFGRAFDLSLTPSAGFSQVPPIYLLMLIPVINFAVSFIQMKVTRKYTPQPAAADGAAAGMSTKFMDITMPLMITFMAYSMDSSLGVYWIFQTLLAIGQTLLLAKLMPLPVFSEEAYRLAEQKYGAPPSKKKKPVIEIDDPGDLPASNDFGPEGKGKKESGGGNSEPPALNEGSGAQPGINPAVKNKYKKTGKKYTAKKKDK